MASVRSTETRRDEQGVVNDPKKRRRTVDLALISLVTDLAHEQCNALLPVHSDVHGIVMVAEKTCERCVCRGKEDERQPPALTLGHTHQEVPSSLDLLVCETTFFAFPSLCATAVGRCWCRRESVHVTLASPVELLPLAWTDLHTIFIFPLSAPAMATRSKSRVRAPPSSSSTSMGPPPARTQSRPPSVIHKAHALQRSGTSDDIPDPQLRPTASTKPRDPENNIQVAIRCRRRSEREINDASPIIVQMDGAKSQDISIDTSVPTSSLGVVTLPPTRKYPFDAVFGPEASQELVYDEVVQPMLVEVLEGYNCTLFAYGQTGTGKT